MAAPAGRREASKQATRAALWAAAKQMFAEQGYEATTVRDIARAADVTERTFYRYFDGKQDLVAHEYRSWLATLRDAIVARPADEPPLTAVRRAMVGVAGQARAAAAPAPIWPLSDRPLAAPRQSAARPLLRFEDSVAAAILARPQAGRGITGGSLDPGEEFRAQVVGRVAVAAFRSAMIRYRELQASGQAAPPVIEQLIDDAFAIVSSQ